MSTYAQRETRYPVWLPARMKWHGDWSDFTIGNVSGGGVMGLCDRPPPEGEMIELQYGNWLVSARVAWRSGDRFGARSLVPITFDDLLGAGQLKLPSAKSPDVSPSAGARAFLSNRPPPVLTAPKLDPMPVGAMLAALVGLLTLLLYLEIVRQADEAEALEHREFAGDGEDVISMKRALPSE